MSVLVTNHDFTHGVLDKSLRARSDLEYYNKAAATLDNMIVLPGGGVQTRFSTEWLFNFDFSFMVSGTTVPLYEAGMSWTHTNGTYYYLLPVLTPPSAAIPYANLAVYKYDPYNATISDRFIYEDTATLISVGEYPTPSSSIYNDAIAARIEGFQENPKTSYVIYQNQLIFTNSSFGTWVIKYVETPGYWMAIPLFQSAPDPTVAPGTPIGGLYGQNYKSMPSVTLGIDISSTVFQIPNVPTQAAGGELTITITTPGVLGDLSEDFVGGMFESLGPPDNPSLGSGRIFAVTSTTEFVVIIVTPFNYDNTTSPLPTTIDLPGSQSYLSKTAYNDRLGFAECVGVYEDRVILAGGKSTPDTMFFSAVGDITSWMPGANDSDAVSYTMASSENDKILHVLSGRSLMVFTDHSECAAPVWGVDALTPSSVSVRRQTNNGSEDVTPMILDNQAIFVKKGGKAIMAMEYGEGNDSYSSNSVTITCSDLINSPEQIIPYTTNSTMDTNLAFVKGYRSLLIWQTLEAENVSAWSTTSGFPPLEGAYSQIGDRMYTFDDHVIYVSAGVNAVFQFDFNSDNMSDCALDAYADNDNIIPIGLPSDPSTTIIDMEFWPYCYEYNNLDQTSLVILDRNYEGNFTNIIKQDIEILNGSGPDPQWYIDVTDIYGVDSPPWVLGIPFTSTLKTLPAHVITQSGDTLYLKKRITKLYIQYMDAFPFNINGRQIGTNGGVIVGSEEEYDMLPLDSEIVPLSVDEGFNKSSGIYAAPFLLNGWTRDATITITITGLVMTILGITMEIN